MLFQVAIPRFGVAHFFSFGSSVVPNCLSKARQSATFSALSLVLSCCVLTESPSPLLFPERYAAVAPLVTVLEPNWDSSDCSGNGCGDEGRRLAGACRRSGPSICLPPLPPLLLLLLPPPPSIVTRDGSRPPLCRFQAPFPMGVKPVHALCPIGPATEQKAAGPTRMGRSAMPKGAHVAATSSRCRCMPRQETPSTAFPSCLGLLPPSEYPARGPGQDRLDRIMRLNAQESAVQPQPAVKDWQI